MLPLAFGYLDHITLRGDPEVVEADVDSLERGYMRLGLAFNRNKCEFIASDFDPKDTNKGSLRLLARIIHRQQCF